MESLSFRCYRAWIIFGFMLGLTIVNCFWIAQLGEPYWIRTLMCLGVGMALGLVASVTYILWMDHAPTR